MMMPGQQQDQSEVDDGVGQWQKEDSDTGHADAQKLLSVLSRVEGLSTADFLNAGVVETSDL